MSDGLLAAIAIREGRLAEDFSRADLRSIIWPPQERWSFQRRAGAKWLSMFGAWHYYRGRMEIQWELVDGK